MCSISAWKNFDVAITYKGGTSTCVSLVAFSEALKWIEIYLLYLSNGFVFSGKMQNSSLMMSESEFSSDEETLFVNHKKTNGHITKLNGISKQNIKTKLRT